MEALGVANAPVRVALVGRYQLSPFPATAMLLVDAKPNFNRLFATGLASF